MIVLYVLDYFNQNKQNSYAALITTCLVCLCLFVVNFFISSVAYPGTSAQLWCQCSSRISAGAGVALNNRQKRV